MKTLDADARSLCRMQALVFERSVQLQCASAVFIRRFMNSNVALRMDGGGFLSESSSPEGVLTEVEGQYGKSTYGSVTFSAEELHWMGYLYRYWVCLFGKPSAAVYKIIGANELRGLFPRTTHSIRNRRFAELLKARKWFWRKTPWRGVWLP